MVRQKQALCGNSLSLIKSNAVTATGQKHRGVTSCLALATYESQILAAEVPKEEKEKTASKTL